MAQTNAQRQAAWRERHVVVLTDDIESIAAKLLRLERRKLRTLLARIGRHLKTRLRGVDKRDKAEAH